MTCGSDGTGTLLYVYQNDINRPRSTADIFTNVEIR